MKRSFKNLINVLLIVVILIFTIFTVYHVKESSANSNGNNNFSNNNVMPSMPNNDNNGANSNSNNGENSTENKENTPPEKPNDSFSNSEGNTNGSNSSENNNSSTSGNTPPQKPDDNTSNQNGNMPNIMNNNGMKEESNNKISVFYYVIFITEGALISGLLVYLIMSNFNKKSIKETFVNKDKIIISILSVIILTSTITCIDIKLVNLKSNNTNSNNLQSVTYKGETEITSDKTVDGQSYSSKKADSNAILVSDGATVKLSNIKVNKTGDSNGGDNTSFYGMNSAVLAKDKSVLTITNATITTNANGANGVFSYDGSATTNNSSSDGTTVNISDSTITTKKDNSGGIMTTGGGITNATNLTVTTSGTSSAAIRTDRGGGKVIVNKGTYKTTGKGSPAIYSTADVSVSNAKLISNASEGVVIEGKNSVKLDNVTLTDTNNELNGKSTTYKNIFLYQSMSGDASSGTAEFIAKNSKITTNKGDFIYVTNTSSNITLENNELVNNDSEGNFIRIQKDSWGNSGSNGGSVTLTLTNQKANGNIVVDSISSLNMNLENASYYEGAINKDNTAKSIIIKLDKNSKIKLTSDSYITSLDNADTTNSNIDFNGYKLYVNNVSIN